MSAFQQTFQFRAYTSGAGYVALDRVLAMQARLYNAALENRRTAWKQAGVSINYSAQCKELTDVRGDDPEMAAVSRRFQCGTLKRLDRAYKAFFRRDKAGEKPGHPRFKAGRRWHTLEPDCPKYDWRSWLCFRPEQGRLDLTIKGLPRLELKVSAERCAYFHDLAQVGKWTALKIVRKGRRVTVNLTFEVEKETLPKTGAIVGLDMGVSSRIATSDGGHIPGVKAERKRKRVLQRRISRAVKGSKSRRSKVAMLSNYFDRKAVSDRNAAHRITTELIRQYDLVVVEHLAIRNMTASARGTAEEPGVNVRAKAGLNREILAQNWGMVRQQLAYKAEWAGKRLVAVPPQYTSQDCSRCGQRNTGPTPGRLYHCENCGLALDRDENAAINILRRGLSSVGPKPCPSAPQAVPQPALLPVCA